jgi:4-amino-4-deoxy-L-arabinose transferase-like glycosyltransferase
MAAIWTLVGGESLLAVRVVQMALALATVGLVYRLGTEMFDAKAGAWAAIGVAVYPSLLFSNVTLLTETVFTFLLVLTVWFCHVGLRDGSLLKIMLAGLSCGLASLTRSVLWPFPVVGAAIIVAANRGPWWRRLGMAAAFSVCHALVLTPWAIRNTRLQGVFVVVDTIGGFNLWMANSDATPEDRIWASVSLGGDEQFARVLALEFPERRLTEGEKDRWGRNAAFRYIIGHPAISVQRSLRKFADFWGLDRELLAGLSQGIYSPPHIGALLVASAVLLAYPTTMLLTAAGVWSTARSSWPTHLMVGAVVLFTCAIHTLVFGHSRYRLPLMPFLLIYAAAAVRAETWQFLRKPGWRTACAASTVAGLIGIWLHEILVRDAERVHELLHRLNLMS